LDTQRIVVGLQWIAITLFTLGVLFVGGAIVWPSSSDDLISATKIAAAGFGLPATIAYIMAHWFDAHQQDDRDGDPEAASGSRAPNS
jgi:hypothetical protein